MAKVKFSALISGMSGKLNGSVFARNAGGDYLRTKVTPVNPQSQAQTEARNLLAQFSQGWRSLTEAQRLAWSGAVSNWSTTDVFGDVQNPKGNTLYTRLNINIANAGGAAISVPPSPVGVSPVQTVSLTAAQTGNAFSLAFTPDPIPADHALFVEATPSLSPGINNANSEFRKIAVVDAAGISPADLSAAYVAKFGSLSAGQKVFVRAKMIHKTTGEVSQALVTSAIIGA